MSFCSCPAKCILFLFNFIVSLLGIGILVVGILVKKSSSMAEDAFTKPLNSWGIVFIILGVVVFAISFFGCCGAFQEDSCLLSLYGMILLALLIIEFAIGIYVLKNRDEILVKGHTAIEKKFKDEINTNNTKIIDSIQKSLKCCGFNSLKEYKGSVIPSCCGKTKGKCENKDIYKDPCETKIKEFFMHNTNMIAGLGIAFPVIEVCGVVLSFYLAHVYRRR